MTVPASAPLSSRPELSNPVAADYLPINDTVSSPPSKKITIANLQPIFSTPTLYDAEVGSAETYISVGNAYVGGLKTLVINSNITDSTEIILANGHDIFVVVKPGVVWSVSTTFSAASLTAQTNLTIVLLAGAELAASGDTNILLSNTSAYLNVNIIGEGLVTLSGAGQLYSIGAFYTGAVSFQLTNNSSNKLSAGTNSWTANSTHIIGGGTSCSIGLSTNGGNFTNIRFDGIWATNAHPINNAGSVSTFDGITFDIDSAFTVEFSGVLGSWVSVGSGEPTLNVTYPNDLVWVPVAAYSVNWASTAEVAIYDNGRMAVMRGRFTSLSDNNDDPCGVFPSLHMGNFSKIVSINKAGTVERIYSNEVTWTGGGATLSHAVTGVQVGDYVACTVKNKGTQSNYAAQAVAASNAVNFEVQTAATSNDLVLYCQVERTNNVRATDIGTTGSGMGVGATMNTADYVWANICYEVVADA